ncbi:MAG TPA: hypothetical protein VMD77_04990 [Candidatus Baltobacteraceae bacterium]|jgi:hypothetical protein|nr:hypothetical protein [Candidatus Baltobacteraceae bacterium]
MSAIARPGWNIGKSGLTASLPHAPVEETAMREKLAVIRDTMIVLSMQLVFRTVMLLRRWNY